MKNVKAIKPEEFKGKSIVGLTPGEAHGYDATSLVIVFDDDTRLVLVAGTVNYDQFSTSPSLFFDT